MKTALYPGTFDPVTLGHLDVFHRATQLFDKVVIAVARNEEKAPTFDASVRVELIRQNLAGTPNADVQAFDGLLIDFAKEVGAVALIRGLRAISDFEYELQMAQMNRNLDETVETIFLMPKEAYTFISSNLIKQVAQFGGDISKFVPGNVFTALQDKFPQLKD